MRLEDLQLGDLVFFVSPTLGIVEHTAIFLGIKDQVPYIIHATKEPYFSIMVTRLKQDDAEFFYEIMRPQNTTIAIEAVAILLAWIEFQVPYASTIKCSQLMAEAERHFSLEIKASAHAQMIFGTEGYIRNYEKYIEMAHNLPFVTKTIAESGVGCAESITMAFNLACFILHATYQEEIKTWVTLSSIDEFLSELPNPLPFDSARALSAGIFEYCQHHMEHWLNLGGLEPWEDTHLIDAEDKEAWRTFKQKLKSRAQELAENIKESPTDGRSRSRTFTEDSGKNSFDAIDFLEVIEFTARQIEEKTGSPVLGASKSPITAFFSPGKFKSISTRSFSFLDSISSEGAQESVKISENFGMN